MEVARGTHLAFDLETTGVDSFRDVPVSFGFVVVDDAGRRREGGLVNPGLPIPPAATAIHAITNEMVADAPALEVATEALAARLCEAWASGAVVVGMNVAYDLTMVDALCRRFGTPSLSERAELGPVVDVLIVDRHFDRWRKGGRKLGDLCRHYAVATGDAHSALDDANASLEIFYAQLAQFAEFAALERDKVNDQLATWYREWLASFSNYLERRGERPIAPGRYEWPINGPA